MPQASSDQAAQAVQALPLEVPLQRGGMKPELSY